MKTQSYREYQMKEDNGFFIVTTKGEEALMKELYDYCKEHKNQHVWYYKHPVRPQKGCPIPEYSMEVIINPKGLPVFYRMAQ